MGRYIKEAKKFYEEAIKDFQRGKKEDKLILIQDASEKAWGAIVQATNELFDKKGIPIPRTHRERREFLDKLEEEFPEIKKMGLSDRFSARDHILHERCFYQGICEPIEVIEKNIIKVKKFIDDVEEIIGGS